jgi:trehalose 6-phosphate phosphatase
MTLSAIQSSDDIVRRLKKAHHGLLLFDFDGTLTPLVSDHTKSRLFRPTRNVLRSLAKKHHVTVGIISGRSLKDIRRLIGLTGLVYAGNHGYEILGKDFKYTFPDRIQKIRTLNRILANVSEVLQQIPGTHVENKGMTASIHYRQMPLQYMDRFRRILRKTLLPAIRRYHFHIVAGKKTFDIFPTRDWNKGKAVEWIRSQIDPAGVVLYMGDDKTDEDVFRHLYRRDIAIRIGNGGRRDARYYLRHPLDTQRFLKRLVSL